MYAFLKLCFYLLIITSNILPNVFGLEIKNLGGSWSLSNVNGDYNLPVNVPGGIYTDLMKNGIIGDIFYGFNDVETRWISLNDWNYSTEFSIDSQTLQYDNINLVFDGVDTFSKILINDEEVGTTENMFVRYVFNVKSYLLFGTNKIEVQFKSPVIVAKNLAEEQARNYVVPPKCVPSEYNGECHVNHIRKMQASFSWDWGPAFPSMGIWKPVHLEAYNSTVIRDVTTDIRLKVDNDYWVVNFTIYFEKNSKNVIHGLLNIQIETDVENVTTISKIQLKENINGEFVAIRSIKIPKTYVRLWWPNGYGESPLYNTKITFSSANKLEKSSKTLRIGYRTVELVQNKLKSGNTFYFKINNVPIFAKGSNSIPINILPELGQNETTIRFLLQSAKDVHMNMLRVWGGGVYESGKYYEIADELGILIWQDFMFACSMYPTPNDFLKNVNTEVKQQVRRLQHHPSIILWAGNNENELALRQNWYSTKNNFSLYKEDYIKLYVDTIRSEVLQNDKTRSYLVSSPTNGVKSEKEGFIAQKPGSNFYGDIHFYNYIFDSWDTILYPISRFASEYGYQSLPTIETLLTAITNITDLDLSSAFLQKRQHHLLGYVQMELLISYQFNLPPKSSDGFFNAFVYYGQVIQAMAIKTETEYYRQWRSSLNVKGEGFTMGALYWQLNDVWVAPSWSGIDFQNKWKMLHYFAKEFFAPIIITGRFTVDKKLQVFVVSDLLKYIGDATAIVSIYKWDSFNPVNQKVLNVDVLPGFSSQIIEMDNPCGEISLTHCLIYFQLRNSTNNNIAPNNYIFPVDLRNAALEKSNLKIVAVKQIDVEGKLFEIEIEANVITLFVWLEAKEVPGRFSENGFLLITNKHTIQFLANASIDLQIFHKSLLVTYALDTRYYPL